MKVALIGHPGSGKTYLAEKLAKKLSLPIVDLDGLFDKRPHRLIARRSYRRAFNSLLQDKTEWIMDGYHGKRMPNWIWADVDLIIFLDLDRSILKQNIIERQKDAKAKGDFSHWQIFKLNNYKNFAQIKLFDKSLRQDFEYIEDNATKSEFIVLKSMQQINHFLDTYSSPVSYNKKHTDFQ